MSPPSDSSAPAEAEIPAPVVKRIRRVSSKPPKNPTASKPTVQAAAASPATTPEHVESRPAPPGPKVSPWTEPEVIEGASAGESAAKRKRKRRRKGKGAPSQNPGNSAYPDSPAGEPDGPLQTSARTAEAPSGPPQDSSPVGTKSRAPRPSGDPSIVSKMAWKLYLGEIGEEGIALIDDPDARDLARRCFRLAEIFLDEQARRVR